MGYAGFLICVLCQLTLGMRVENSVQASLGQSGHVEENRTTNLSTASLAQTKRGPLNFCRDFQAHSGGWKKWLWSGTGHCACSDDSVLTDVREHTIQDLGRSSCADEGKREFFRWDNSPHVCQCKAVPKCAAFKAVEFPAANGTSDPSVCACNVKSLMAPISETQDGDAWGELTFRHVCRQENKRKFVAWKQDPEMCACKEVPVQCAVWPFSKCANLGETKCAEEPKCHGRCQMKYCFHRFGHVAAPDQWLPTFNGSEERMYVSRSCKDKPGVNMEAQTPMCNDEPLMDLKPAHELDRFDY